MDASFTKQASDAKQFKPGIDQIYLKHSPGINKNPAIHKNIGPHELK